MFTFLLPLIHTNNDPSNYTLAKESPNSNLLKARSSNDFRLGHRVPGTVAPLRPAFLAISQDNQSSGDALDQKHGDEVPFPAIHDFEPMVEIFDVGRAGEWQSKYCLCPGLWCPFVDGIWRFWCVVGNGFVDAVVFGGICE
jgi:hypothetical protein